MLTRYIQVPASKNPFWYRSGRLKRLGRSWVTLGSFVVICWLFCLLEHWKSWFWNNKSSGSVWLAPQLVSSYIYMINKVALFWLSCLMFINFFNMALNCCSSSLHHLRVALYCFGQSQSDSEITKRIKDFLCLFSFHLKQLPAILFGIWAWSKVFAQWRFLWEISTRHN